MTAAPTVHVDLVVVGAGSGGLAAAFRAAEYGARVALCDPGLLGGTCVNVGCVPKKAMWFASDLSARIDMAARLGFDVPRPVLDWREFVVHRQHYIENIHASYRRRLDAAGILVVPEHATLLGDGRVAMAGGTVYAAPRIVVATGGRPRRPDIPGAGLALDSDGFFNLCAAPARVAVVGGGYIALELAGILQLLGSRVDILVREQRLLVGFDRQLVDQLCEDYAHHGTRTRYGTRVHALLDAGEGRIDVELDGGMPGGTYDSVILAIGRVPNTEGLGLDDIGVALDDQGRIVVDAFQRTNVEGLHAIGDVTPDAALTPVAIAAARRLMDRLFGGDADAKLDHDDIPSIVYAHPPLGRVGLTEKDARERFGDDAVRVLCSRFRPMLHALADSPQRSLFKLVLTGDDDRVVGIHLLGESADEILQGFAVALKRGLTLADLHATMALHPTSAEELVLMR